jgi:endonuclease YncB( thermonuclease family)
LERVEEALARGYVGAHDAGASDVLEVCARLRAAEAVVEQARRGMWADRRGWAWDSGPLRRALDAYDALGTQEATP